MSGRILFRLRGDRRGVTIVEFAMILPALCVLLLGIFELGYRAYAASVLQGALHEAARMATIGGVSMEQIDARVRARLSNFANHGTVTINASSYYDFAGVRRPERLLIDTAPTGEYNQGDCWEDVNGNNAFDQDRGRSGMGQADDIVRYEVSLDVPNLVPIHRFLGWASINRISGETALRNQPYGSRSIVINRLQWRQNSGVWELGTC